MEYGYARISTVKQNIDRQIRNIKQDYPNAVIVQETYTGTKTDRPEWTKLLKRVKAGDTIVFDEVSRMSRNAEEGFALYKDLYNKKINLVYLKEPYMDTDSYRDAMQGILSTSVQSGDKATDDLIAAIMDAINQFMMQKIEKDIFKAFEMAQKEVDYLHQRTKEGIETARLNGKQIGLAKGTKLVTKKSISAKETIKKHAKDFGGSLTDKELMQMTGLARNTYYSYKRALKHTPE